MKKNTVFNVEWLFNELDRIVRNPYDHFEFTCPCDKIGQASYFDEVCDEARRQKLINIGAEFMLKPYPSFTFRTVARELYNQLSDSARVNLAFSSDLVWKDEEGKVCFNNNVKRFALRLRDPEDDNYPELCTTFDLTSRGIWQCGFTSVHGDGMRGGRLSIPSFVIEGCVRDWLRLVLSQEDIAEALQQAARHPEKVAPQLLIVDDTVI